MSNYFFKGFTRRLTCKGHQFEVGGTYSVTGDVVSCKNGFHACKNPLAVFCYYSPLDSRYAVVELSGLDPVKDVRDDGDKTVGRTVAVVRELSLSDLLQQAAALGQADVVSRASKDPACANGQFTTALATQSQGLAYTFGAAMTALAAGREGTAAGSAVLVEGTGGAGAVVLRRRPRPVSRNPLRAHTRPLSLAVRRPSMRIYCVRVRVVC